MLRGPKQTDSLTILVKTPIGHLSGINLQRDQSQTMSENFIVHDRGVVVEVDFFNGDGWDL